MVLDIDITVDLQMFRIKNFFFHKIPIILCIYVHGHSFFSVVLSTYYRSSTMTDIDDTEAGEQGSCSRSRRMNIADRGE